MKKLSLFLWVFLLAAPAFAQKKSSAAKACLDAAEKLTAGRDYQAAFEKYQACYQEFPDNDFLVFIGGALINLRRYQDALSTFEECVSKTKDSKVKANAKRNITLLQDILATAVTITSEPVGATVFLNSKVDTPLGLTPLTANVPAGTARLYVELEGHQGIVKPVEIVKGTISKFDFTLKEAPALVKVQTTPSGARVFIDGAEVGSSPYEGPVSLGGHDVSATKAGFGTFRAKIDAKRGATLEVSGELPPPDGTLVLNAGAENLVVKLNGEAAPAPVAPGEGAVGQGALVPWGSLSLAPGEYKLQVSAKGFREVERQVTLNSGETQTLDILLPKRGLYVTLPAEAVKGATVTLAGKAVADPSQPLFVAEGSQAELVIEKTGALPVRQLLSGAQDADSSAQIEFRKPKLRFTYLAAIPVGLGLGLGTVFGVQAFGKAAEFKESPTKQERDDALALARRSDLAFGVGAVALAGALWLARKELRGAFGRSPLELAPAKKP
jgi:hypothetical protein